MERLQNLKCLDTHFLAVELIVRVVFLVLFNTVSDRQSAVVHVVYCFYDVCRTYYQRSDRIFKRFYHWPDTHEDRESQTVDPGYIIFCCTSCIYGVQLPAQSGTDGKNGMGICLLSDAYCSVRANISISRRCLWSTDFNVFWRIWDRIPWQRCFMNLQSDLPHRWKHR